MSAIRALLVDDESPAREELKFLLRAYPDFFVAGEAEDGISALEAYRTGKPDLVFLDIQIPGIQGIDLAATLSGMAEPPLIVFVTAFDSYAVRAFELNALDYLLKPIAEERFAETVRRIRETCADREGKYQEYLKGLRSLVRGYAPACEDGGDEREDGDSGAPHSEYLTIYKDGRYCPVLDESDYERREAAWLRDYFDGEVSDVMLGGADRDAVFEAWRDDADPVSGDMYFDVEKLPGYIETAKGGKRNA